MDWDVSEDGEIDAVDEQAPLRENRPAPPRLDDDASLDDIRSVMLTRKRAAELCCAQFFPEYVKGTWVRVSVGFAKDDPKREIKYRVAEVRGTLSCPASLLSRFLFDGNPCYTVRRHAAQEVLRGRKSSNQGCVGGGDSEI